MRVKVYFGRGPRQRFRSACGDRPSDAFLTGATQSAAGGPPAPSEQWQLLRAPEDFRLFFLKLIQHPEQLPQASADMEAQMKKYFQK